MNKKKLASFLILALVLFFNMNTVIASTFFIDVFGHWAEEEVFWATNEVELFIGYGDSTFRPDNNITRSEYITILHRAALQQGIIEEQQDIYIEELEESVQGNGINGEVTNGSNEEENTLENIQEVNTENKAENTIENDEKSQVLNYDLANEKVLDYDDLESNFWAFNDIEIVAGYINTLNNTMKFHDVFPGNKFYPNNYITREEAIVLTSFFTLPPIDTDDLKFHDITKEYEFYEQLKNLTNNGIIQGYEDNTFRPKRNITRAEAATIIQNIFYEMEYKKDKYLKSIQLLSDIYENKFMFFGDYKERELSKEDLLYKKAISTLEYKSLVGTIPFGEKHLYDSEPLKTLKTLKDTGYWNIIGINNYLIEFVDLDEQQKRNFTIEILEDYVKRDDINSNEAKLIFKKIMNYLDEKDMVLSGLDKWYDTVEKEDEMLNVIFLKSIIYLENDEYDKALELFNLDINKEEVVEAEENEVSEANQGYKFENIENKKYYVLNKSYILLKMKNFDGAIGNMSKFLKEIQDEVYYIAYKDEFDVEIKGSIKKVLVEKEEFVLSEQPVENNE